MTELTIDGETFRVEVEGDPERPAVLLSCSLGTDLSLFDAQMPALLQHFRVVRYDPRGHGRSTIQGAPYSLDRLGADALAILDSLGIEDAHVLGVSMGGAVAQWLLVNAPDRIGRAVLANTAARIGTPAVWNARIATVLADGTGALAEATMERWFGDAFRTAAPDRVAAVERTFRATAAQGYAGCCAALRDADLREAIRGVDSPVLVVTGRDDPVTSAADIAAMTSGITGARHVVLDCRHISNIEEEAAFNAAVVGFLTETVPARIRSTRKAATPGRRPSRRVTVARSPLERPVVHATGAKRGASAPAVKTALKPGSAPVRRAATSAARVTAAQADGAAARKTKPAKAAAKAPAKAPAKAAAKAPAKAAAKAAAKAPAKAPAKTRTSPKAKPKKTRGVAGAGIARTSAARKPVTKKATTKKAAAKKTATKKATKKTAQKVSPLKKPAARRPSKSRPSGRRR